MTLHQYQELRLWHLRHWRRHPVEKNFWDVVLTLWMMGWAGGPGAMLIGQPWAVLACVGLVFLPSLYVGVRRYLHRRRLLRCDWAAVLR